MNKKELRHLSSDCEYFLNGNGRGEINLHNFVENLRTTYIEPKEKRIAELEKANAQWKQRNETLKDALEHAGEVYGDDLEKAYKENAALKLQIKIAKEIINNLLIIHNDTFGNTDLKWRCNVIAEAENFYKEE